MLQRRKFSPFTPPQIRELIMEMQTQSSKLDLIPTHLLNRMLPLCLNGITKLMNMSMQHGIFCDECKTAVVRPLLKKIGLELINKNYRPVNNLPFLGKLLEKCMLKQLVQHTNQYNLIPDIQSAYRANHSHHY